jgi:hypothetical protein
MFLLKMLKQERRLSLSAAKLFRLILAGKLATMADNSTGHNDASFSSVSIPQMKQT